MVQFRDRLIAASLFRVFRQCKTPAQEDKVCNKSMGHSQVLEKGLGALRRTAGLEKSNHDSNVAKAVVLRPGLLPCNITGKRYAGTNLLTLLMLTEVKGYRICSILDLSSGQRTRPDGQKGSKQFPGIRKPFYQANNPTDGQRRYLTVEEYNALPESARASMYCASVYAIIRF